MLLTQLSGCLMDVPVPVMDCYRPNSVRDDSGLALSLFIVSSLARLSLRYFGKGELLDDEGFRQNFSSVPCRLFCLAERVFPKQGNKKCNPTS